jgi:plastocyanin
MPNYTTYTNSELIQAQNQLSIQTGEEINGILGGLPVASQTQEYFVVFDEAGSTGPEIIDKTQFRITYLVDSQLNTSKPTDEGDAALNATQNFEKSKLCNVRADNATVLNQNLTGKQSIYDIGSLQLISTTEYGKAVNEYIHTMSFDGVGGQLVGEAENITGIFRQSSIGDNQLNSDGSQEIQFNTTVTAISQSNGDDEWVTFDGTKYQFIQSTYAAGTRVRANLSFDLRINQVYAGNTVTVQINLYRDPVGDSAIQLLGSFNKTVSVLNQPIPPESFAESFSIIHEYLDFAVGDRIYAEIIRGGGSTNPNTNIYLKTTTISFQQETPPGDILIIGVNATTSSYWDGVTTISGSNIPTNELSRAYSVLTGSEDLSLFSNGNYIQRINTASAAFDPVNDGNTFNPIQLPFQFQTGDEIRFEYNKNKVHTVIKTESDEDGRLLLFITPGVNTQVISVDEPVGTQLNHFTHYRIIKNGGYLFINTKKDNVAGVEQDFNGIITPQFPTLDLQSQGDQLIYQLKQAGIIET